MILSSRIFLFHLIVFILFTILGVGQAQKSVRKKVSPGTRLELLHADVSRGILQDNKRLRILEGHVHARQDTLELFCDRAIYDEQLNKIILTGNVKVVRGTDTLTARQIAYFERTRIAVAEGEVRVRRPGQDMKSDYMEYHYQSNHIRARGNLRLYDAENSVWITAHRGEYIPEKNISYVEKNAHFWRVDSSGTDTLHIFSRRMEYYADSLKRAVARDSVRIIRENLVATADSAVYLVDEEIAYLEGSPYAVQENNEMFGNQMQLILKDMELQQIRVIGAAQAISLVDSAAGLENQLEGREIVMYISNRELRELWAISNARSLYYLQEAENARGTNVASADTIKAFFNKNELDSIAVIGGTQGTYYPEDYKGPIVQE